ncbi:MAG: hypothetical protein ACI97P_002084 [Arcticibacterium sp.]|jgi:hypothetical protein
MRDGISKTTVPNFINGVEYIYALWQFIAHFRKKELQRKGGLKFYWVK